MNYIVGNFIVSMLNSLNTTMMLQPGEERTSSIIGDNPEGWKDEVMKSVTYCQTAQP